MKRIFWIAFLLQMILGFGQSNDAQLNKKFERLQKDIAQGSSSPTPISVVANQEEIPEGKSIWVIGTQIFCGLLFVLFLMIVTLRLLKKAQSGLGRKALAVNGQFFEVLETCHIGTQQKIIALRMQNDVGIIGVTTSAITLLQTLEGQATTILQQQSKNGNTAEFADNLNKLLDRFKKPKKVADYLKEG